MRRSVRRLVFAAVPAIALGLAATAVLSWLESSGRIATERPDDAATHAPIRPVKKKWTARGAWWVIPKSGGLIESAVPVRKRPGTFRVMIAGESFAQGSPYVHHLQETPGHGGIGDWMRAELAARFPSREFELVNVGAAGGLSNVVRDVVRAALVVEPDVLVVGMGNNEGYVSRTPVNDALHEWVVYRAMKRGLLASPRPEERPWFTPQDAQTREVVRGFRENVLAILDAAGAAGVPVVWMTLPIHYHYRGIDPGQGDREYVFPEDDPAFIEGAAMAARGDCAAAAAVYARSPHQAYAAKLTGQCLENAGDFAASLDYYRVYVENLPMNRTRPSFNAFVRETMRERGVPLADLEAAAEAMSPTGITPPSLFKDSCHLTWKGYYEMARVVMRATLDANIVTGAPGEPLPAPDRDALIAREGWQDLYGMP
ncbi:MAG: hypothetical protein KJ042_00240 [Deltaproteobacteria bacterium]|nr:hypothetical protein [Deltaproteobacteria bacterium]